MGACTSAAGRSRPTKRSRPGWTTLAADAADARHLRVEAPEGRALAIFSDPSTGLRFVPIRGR